MNDFFFSDLDSSFYSKVRLPPSGRSSVLSNQYESTSNQNLTPGDFKSVMSLNFSRSSSTNSLKQHQGHQDLGSPAYTTPYQHQNTPFREGVSRKTKSRSYR